MNIVVITNGNFFARVTLERVFLEKSKDISGVVIITGIKAHKSRPRSLADIWLRSGSRYFFYKANTYFVFATAKLLFPHRPFFVPDLTRRYSIPTIYASQVSDSSVERYLREWKPDLMISAGCPQRIPERLLSIPRTHAINVHASLLPKYAGIAPYVWVLEQGETLTGVTVHVMEEKFDSGDIILQKHAEIHRSETVFSLFHRLTKLGSQALAEAIECIEDGTVQMKPQDPSEYTYYSWPKRETIRALRRSGHRLVAVTDYIAAIGANT